MSYSPNRRTSGQINQGLLVVILIGFITFALSQITVFFSKVVGKKIRDSRANVQVSSAAETMLVAYRQNELYYIQQVSGCDSALPFLQALKQGHGCTTSPGLNIQVFSTGNSDAGTATDPGFSTGLYTYVGAGCTIGFNTSTCASGSHALATTSVSQYVRDLSGGPGTAAYQATGANWGYTFYLNTIVPEQQIAEFSAIYNDGKSTSRSSFAIRTSLTNTAHLEVDGRVTQQNPDPLNVCSGSVWANFNVFNPKQRQCQTFVQLGSGTGLFYYKGRYFGFRPFDGQIIDLLAASDSSYSYLVDTNGNVATDAFGGFINVFVPYDMASLINVDDLTMIGNQIYFVAFSGASAQIGGLYFDGTAWQRTVPPVCDLGARGWAQSYEGIGALSSSDMLMPDTSGFAPTIRYATFFLKTSSGDLLTAAVTANTAGTILDCHVFKDQNLQQVEYKRTYGFDRAEPVKPYFLY